MTYGVPESALWEERLRIDGPRGKLEALLSRAEESREDCGVIVACPHPRFGGDFSNNVVATLARFLAGRGFPVLRFNYHGVGRSDHEEESSVGRLLYWATISEIDARERTVDDLLASRAFLASLVGRVHAVGYSLGAILSLELAARGLCRSVTAVALPIDAHPISGLELVTQPVLAIQAPLDFASRLEDVEQQLAKAKGPVCSSVIPGADHFFRGLEPAVAALAAEFIAWVAGPAGSLGPEEP